MEIDADLHLHSPHAGGVSDRMQIPVMAEQADRKGLDLVGTGDALHPGWRDHLAQHLDEAGDGIYRHDGTDFLLTAEVEDTDRIHHVLLFPDLGAVEEVYDTLTRFSRDIDTEGRPHLQCSGSYIAQVCERHGVLIGPAHAFTPWTALYKEFDSIGACYKNTADYVAFLELGLSADSGLADRISHHHDLRYVSFSDAHSPWPHRLGREFTRFAVADVSFSALAAALQGGSGGPVLNVGFDPRHGKYHCTACTDCGQSYTLQQAQQFQWRCDACGRSIKKGVKDRIGELADTDHGDGPDHRPPYRHMLPLAELIQEVVGHAAPTTKTVQRIYDSFQDRFTSETAILIDADIDALRDIHGEVADAIAAFRDGRIIVLPGGGGSYGELKIAADDEEYRQLHEQFADRCSCRYEKKQTQLGTFT